MYICISLRKKFIDGIKLPWIIPVLGTIISIYIMSQCAINQIIIGSALIIIGIPLYVIFAPKTVIKTVIMDLRLGKDYMSQTIERDEIFLAKFIKQVNKLLKKI